MSTEGQRLHFHPFQSTLNNSPRRMYYNSNIIHFSTAIKLQRIQAFLQNYFKELYSARFDLSITALVLILDISCLTRLPRESSCHANRWTDHMRLFRALQSRNWNARFCSTKKNWKASENVQKSEITLYYILHTIFAKEKIKETGKFHETNLTPHQYVTIFIVSGPPTKSGKRSSWTKDFADLGYTARMKN